MHDPEFVTPESKVLPGDPLPPVSRMARTGLVFGILSYLVLPVLGAIVAIVLGHFAHWEIEDSQGRVGGRPVARAAQVLGYLNLLLAALILGTVVYFVRDSHHERGSPTTIARVARSAPRVVHGPIFGQQGLRHAQELSPDENAYLMERLELKPGEEIVCVVPDAIRSGRGAGQVTVLTNRSVASVRDGDVTFFPLEEMQVETAEPGQVVMRCKDGKQVRLSLPGNDGKLFQRALERAREHVAAHGHDAGDLLRQIQIRRGAGADDDRDHGDDSDH
jgi:hypothetical protein